MTKLGPDAAGLLPLLVCPVCRRGDLLGLDETLKDGDIHCSDCGNAYPVRGGIPILLPPEIDTAAVHDELDQAHKQRQAGFFDREVAETFEINRPHESPRAYEWLMAEKFRLGAERLPRLRGATVVDACCGSGMEAEFLARAGAKVIAIDISEGCAIRARKRAERYQLDYLVVVGDVERLPVRTRAADISYVHDGLHHLAEPVKGIRELGRVAAKAVSINEPGDALATKFAVRLGVALAEEGAGNRVARLRGGEVRRELELAGFQTSVRRYLMYYKHEPGSVMRLVSRPGLHQAYRVATRLANAALGRWGNKLQVTAVRPGQPAGGGGQAN